MKINDYWIVEMKNIGPYDEVMCDFHGHFPVPRDWKTTPRMNASFLNFFGGCLASYLYNYRHFCTPVQNYLREPLVIYPFEKLSRKNTARKGENHETLTNITLRYARLRNSVLESLSVTQQQKQQLGAANATLVHFLCSPKIQSCCPRMSDVHSCCCNAYTHDGRGYRFSS